MTGPHACIGKPLAYREMRHVVARLMLVFEMSLPLDTDPERFVAGMSCMHSTFFTEKLLVKITPRPNSKLES